MSMETNGLPKLDNVIFGEIQLLLAEKRTALASLRTGIAVFALPLSVLSALIATSLLLQHGEGDASAPEPWSGRARLLAGLAFHPPHSPLREPDPRAQRKISVNRGVYRVAPTNRSSLRRMERAGQPRHRSQNSRDEGESGTRSNQSVL